MDAEREFDFLEGQWDGVCRVPTESGWVTAPATLTASQQLDRTISVEYFEGTYHGGTVKGLGLRAFNRETREWEHTWADNLEPGHFRIWKGAFVDGKIDLFAEWNDDDGQRIKSRLTWSEITADSAHWESARSYDDGKTWHLHWVIDFRRRVNLPPKPDSEEEVA